MATKKTTKKAAKKSAKPPEDFDKLIAEIEQSEAVEVTTDPPAEDGPQDVIDQGGVSTESGLVRTIKGAVRWAWSKVKSNDDDYRGLCLRFVRECFGIDPLYPSAIAAWTEAERKVRSGDPLRAPRGHAGFFRGGQFGHVVVLLGDGYCVSTDVRDPGQANKCRIESIVDRWGYEFIGWTKDLNGEEAPRPVEGPKLTNRQWRIRRLRQAITNARKNGNQAAVRELSEWLADMRR